MPRKKIKLLVVDDEKDICGFVKLLFRKKGFLVYSAPSGSQALLTAKRIKPDIALLDIYLKKGVDGITVLRQMREFIPGCRFVVVTWDKAAEKMQEAKKLGAASYLVKPLTARQLFKVVDGLARGIRKRGRSYG